MKLHHVGFLTKHLNETQAKFEQLGWKLEQEPRYDHVRDIMIAFMSNNGTVVELIEPASENSPMHPLLKRYKNSPYHFCYVTDDLAKEVERLTAEGYTVFSEPNVAPCINDRTVVFLINHDAGMIELVESGDPLPFE